MSQYSKTQSTLTHKNNIHLQLLKTIYMTSIIIFGEIYYYKLKVTCQIYIYIYGK